CYFPVAAEAKATTGGIAMRPLKCAGALREGPAERPRVVGGQAPPGAMGWGRAEWGAAACPEREGPWERGEPTRRRAERAKSRCPNRRAMWTTPMSTSSTKDQEGAERIRRPQATLRFSERAESKIR